MILQRMRPKYQDRSYRYGLLEAGHVGENAYLAATALGLGACGVGAFMDDAINEMLGSTASKRPPSTCSRPARSRVAAQTVGHVGTRGRSGIATRRRAVFGRHPGRV